MARRKDARRAQKKHAKALKRRQKVAARAASATAPAAPTAAPTDPAARPAPHARPSRARASSVWDPDLPTWGLPGPPPYRSLAGPGPAIVAVPFAESRIALYRRSEDGNVGLVPLEDLPLHHEVAWAGAPVWICEAGEHHVAWSEEPTLDGGSLRGALIVHTLTDGELGLVWSPRITVGVTGKGDDRRVDAEVVGGVLRRDALELEWGTDDTHAAAVGAFLEAHQALLWRMLHGGPSIDTAWRVRAIRGPSAGYKRWAVDDLARHGEEVVPHLVAVLDEVVQGARDPEDLGPLYALSVLAHLRAREAHATLLTLARLDADDFEGVFGGFLTEEFDAALIRTAGGDLDGVRALLRDREADGYLRGQAADALVVAVELGLASREGVLGSLASLLTPEAASDPDSPVWGAVGGAILDLKGVELEAQLVEACESGLIDPMDFGADWVRQSLHGDQPRRVGRRLELARSEDVHAWIGWWAFDE